MTWFCCVTSCGVKQTPCRTAWQLPLTVLSQSFSQSRTQQGIVKSYVRPHLVGVARLRLQECATLQLKEGCHLAATGSCDTAVCEAGTSSFTEQQEEQVPQHQVHHMQGEKDDRQTARQQEEAGPTGSFYFQLLIGFELLLGLPSCAIDALQLGFVLVPSPVCTYSNQSDVLSTS